MCATFKIVDDNFVESEEEFTVAASGAIFAQGQDIARVIIEDNDAGTC